MRCVAAGHEVKMYVAPLPDGSRCRVGDGLIEKVDDYKRWRKWPDLVLLTDNTHYLTDMDYWRRDGVAVVGATPASAELELDRAKGQALFKTHKIPVLDTKEFNDYDAAIAYVAREDDRFVSKVEGSAEDKALSYVSQSPDDMVYMIQRWKKNNKLKGSFILQRFCPGTEMAVGGWLGPDGFLPGWCENWEFKKLMDGDLGVATGEQGTVLRYVPRSKLADKVLKPLEEHLVRLGHTGYVDVNCIIDDDGQPWPLEWTCRPGWPTFNIQQALHDGDPAEWLLNLAQGTSTASPFQMRTVATGVVMSIPDYPYSKLTKKEVTGIPVYGLNGRNTQHLHPCEMMLGSAPRVSAGKVQTVPMLVTAGDYVLVSTGTGATVRASKARAYRALESLTMPNSPMWRTDIGQRLRRQLPKLQSHGYASGMVY